MATFLSKTRLKTIGFIALCGIVFLAGCSDKGNSTNSDPGVAVDSRQTSFQSAIPTEAGTNPYPEIAYLGDDLADESANLDTEDDSGTNQVARMISEADIVDIHGNSLYVLNPQKGLFICDITAPDTPYIKGTIQVTGNTIDMYVHDNRVYILTSDWYDPYRSYMQEDGMIAPMEEKSRVIVIDTVDESNPMVAGTFEFQGLLTDSRIVGDILYVVTSKRDYEWDGVVYDNMPEDDGRPIVVSEEEVDGGKDEVAAPSEPDIVYDEPGKYIPKNEMFVASIDISNPSNIREVDRKSLSGISSEFIHVTEKAIFVTSHEGYYQVNQTRVTYIDISDPSGQIAFKGTVDIKGRINDRYKLDFYDTYLRVCSYTWEGDGESYLTVVDTKDPDRLEIAGSVSLGKGEQLFATRFDKDKAYLVTYERVDPLWVVDLSDPTSPEVKGELIVPGWSTYIAPMGNRLLALGIDDTGTYNRVALSLFDVSDVSNPTLANKVVLGDVSEQSLSVANYDEKALTVLDSLNMVLVPLRIRAYQDNTYSWKNILQLVDFSQDRLVERGAVTQNGEIARTRYYADRILSVTGDELNVIAFADRDAPLITAELEFVTNVRSVAPLANGYGVKMIRKESGKMVLRSFAPEDAHSNQYIGEIAMGTNGYGMVTKGNFVYYLSTDNSRFYTTGVRDPSLIDSSIAPQDTTTTLSIVDFSNPSSPVPRGSISIPGNHYTIISEGQSIGLGHIMPGSNFMMHLNDERLLFVRSNATFWWALDTMETDNPANSDHSLSPQGGKTVFVVDVSAPDSPEKIGEHYLPSKEIYGGFVQSDNFYYSYSDETVQNPAGYGETQFYLGRLDLTLPSSPVEKTPVNIPGICLSIDDSGSVIYTVDFSWKKLEEEKDENLQWPDDDGPHALALTFNTAEIIDDLAYLSDTEDISGFATTFVKTGNHFFFEIPGADLMMIDVTDMNHLMSKNMVIDGRHILGAMKDKLFADNYGNSFCYELNPSDALDLVSRKAGWVSDIRFSNENAFVAMGTEGVWIESL